MTVLLRTGGDRPPDGAWRHWLAVTGTDADLPAARRLPNLPERLEAAFEAVRDDWWDLGRALTAEPGGGYAHMPTAGSFGSDFGLMLAWSRLTAALAAEDGDPALVLCDDPWLFRHLASLPGVDAGRPPGLRKETVRLALRGWAARLRLAVRCAAAAASLAAQRRNYPPGAPAILVYGHPESDAAGHDVYFGDLMVRHPALARVLHTDCPADGARRLAARGRAAALHAWGAPLFALTLPFTRWRPGRTHRTGHWGWLVRRAAARENGGAGVAMNRWQQHCQRRWLAAARPARVLWPWENHGWERALCRDARGAGIPTVGYQHTVVGPHQFNYATATNWDGTASVPDTVVCDGPAYRDEVEAWGVPPDRLVVGGAFRFRRGGGPRHDPNGPVFVPLSAIPAAARAQVAAARRLAEAGHAVLVKDHPMYPLAFDDSPGLRRTDVPFKDQPAVSAMLFATGTSALEAVLAGVPAARLQLADRVAIDILPRGVAMPAVTEETVVETFAGGLTVPHVAWDTVLADIDSDLWARLVHGGPPPTIPEPTPDPAPASEEAL